MNFEKTWNIKGQGLIKVELSTPAKSVGLQATDYFLWALQRCYERKEDRYIEYVWDKIRLVHDIEDKRERKTGMYYNQTKTLKAAFLP